MTTPRGVRNANPGNIDYDGTTWQGLADPPSDGRFCRFVSPEYGIRALCRVLLTYRNKHGLRTVRGIINRWAPPVENDTSAYVRAVARALGVGPDDAIDVRDHATMLSLARAIIQHENGQQPYDAATLQRGLALAGIAAPAAPKAPSRAGLLAAILDLILKLFGRRQ